MASQTEDILQEEATESIVIQNMFHLIHAMLEGTTTPFKLHELCQLAANTVYNDNQYGNWSDDEARKHMAEQCWLKVQDFWNDYYSNLPI